MVRAIALVTLLAGIATVAHAQSIDKPAPEIEFEGKDQNSDKDNWLLIERYRGRLLALYFWRTTSLESTEELKDMAEVYKKYKDKGLIVIPVCADPKDKYEDWQNANPTALGGFSRRLYSFRAFQAEYGIVAEPMVLLIDPRGIIRWRGHPNDQLERRIERLLELYPPPAGDDRLLAAKAREAQKLMDKGELGRAYTLASQLEKYTDENTPDNAKAITLKTTIETEAGKLLKDAIRLEQNGENAEAARIVAMISVRFDNGETDKDKQVQVAQDAAQEIGRMNGKLAMKEEIRDAVEAAKAEIKLDEAAELEEAELYEDALAIYEQMLLDFEDTDAEKDAKRAILRISRDKDIQKVIAARRADRMADRYLSIGEQYTRQRMYEEAREAYKTLLAEHPNSAAAKIAKQAIKDLPA